MCMPEMGVVLAALPIPGGVKAASTNEVHAERNMEKEKNVRIIGVEFARREKCSVVV